MALAQVVALIGAGQIRGGQEDLKVITDLLAEARINGVIALHELAVDNGVVVRQITDADHVIAAIVIGDARAKTPFLEVACAVHIGLRGAGKRRCDGPVVGRHGLIAVHIRVVGR